MTVLIIIIIIGGATAVGVGLAMKKRKYEKKLVGDGATIKRKIEFWENMRTYKFRKTPMDKLYANIIPKLGQTDNSIGYTYVPDHNGIVFQNGHGWKAQMVDTGDSDLESVVVFNFTSWKTYKGMVEGATEMNILVTAVEKAILDFDTTATLDEEYSQTSVRTSFF